MPCLPQADNEREALRESFAKEVIAPTLPSATVRMFNDDGQWKLGVLTVKRVPQGFKQRLEKMSYKGYPVSVCDELNNVFDMM